MNEAKDYEVLAEQAQQARTQFFVYLATSAFLLVTVMSITDKQLLLNNSSITLPLLNIGVPPLFVLIIGPWLLLLTYCNLHIHWFRYVKEVEELNCSTEKARRKLFPIMIYQALYHPKEGLMGFLEKGLAELALFWLLVPIQGFFLWKILKIQYLELCLMEYGLLLVSSFLTVYWLKQSTHQSIISNEARKIIDKLLARSQVLKISPTLTLKNLGSVCGVIYLLALINVIVTSAHLEVSYDVLSPPLELISTPIVAPFIDRMESKKEVKEMQAKHVFENVYWLDLKGKSLRRANFENTVLLKTNLSRADLRSANLEGTNFEQANLEGVNLHHANLNSANLQDASLGSASLLDAKLEDVNLIRVKLERANLQYTLAKKNTQDGFLSYVNLIRLSLERANLQYALAKANTQDGFLNYTNINCGGGFICTNLQHANLSYAKLQYANLERANLQHANLIGAKLQYANLRYVKLKGVYFETRLDKKTGKEVPDYTVGGGTLCEAKTLESATMDDWLFKKLKTLKACNGKLEGVNDPNYIPNY